MEKAYLEILEGIIEELARLGIPEERLRPLRERLLALKVLRMMAKPPPPTPLWGRPLFWTALVLLLAVVAALLGLPVHQLVQ